MWKLRTEIRLYRNSCMCTGDTVDRTSGFQNDAGNKCFILRTSSVDRETFLVKGIMFC